MKNTKSRTLLLFSVVVVGLFALSPTFSSLMNSVVISSTGEISVSSITAKSGSSNDIQAAVNAVHAAGAGTVYVPAGNYTFNILGTYSMTLYATGPVGVLSYPGVNIIGAGINQTVLILNYTGLPNTIYMFGVARQSASGNAPMRISGISFIGHQDPPTGSNTENSYRCITLNSITDFRIDNCYFQDWPSTAIAVYNDAPYSQAEISRGVIDHNSFDNPYRNQWKPHNSSAPGGWALWGYGVVIIGNFLNKGGSSVWDSEHK